VSTVQRGRCLLSAIASVAAAAERDAESHGERHDGGGQLDTSRRESGARAATGGRGAEPGNP